VQNVAVTQRLHGAIDSFIVLVPGTLSQSHLQSLGISLRSATEPIDDTSTGKLMEGVLAAFAQFDNDCRSDPDPGWHEGGTEARPLGVPGAARLLKRAAIDGQELGARS
jgi:hypothetical protein